jgi:carbon monoxide dehydrogenase subunit G
MDIKADIIVQAPIEKVWNIITDIESSVNVISGIKKIEVMEKPSTGLVGLKWEETRIMFGKTATEIMWITEAEENQFYQTRAEHPNVVYISKLSLAEEGSQTRLAMEFKAHISSFGTRIMSAVMGIFFNKATRDAIKQDLEDIKKAAEK